MTIIISVEGLGEKLYIKIYEINNGAYINCVKLALIFSVEKNLVI